MSLSAVLMSVALALVVGTATGLIAGYARGWLDDLLMQMADALLALPFLVLAIALAAILGLSLRNTMIAIAIVTAPVFARILAQREREYEALGARDGRVIVRPCYQTSLVR